MICKNCGNFNEDAANACIVCGADLKADSAPVTDDFSSFGTDGFTPGQTFVGPTSITPVNEDPGKTLGLVSMIVGIVSIVLCNIMGIPCVAAVICGALAMKKSKDAGFKNSQALVGIITGVIGIVFAILAAIVLVVLGVIGAMNGGF